MKLRHVLRALAIGLIIFFPWLPGVPLSFVVNANRAGEYALIAISLVLLTGWVGQISLGHGAFVGVGAFATGLLVREAGIPFPINLPVVAAICGGVATVLGAVALKVRGLYLAVATLIFAWMADAYLFTAPWLVGRGGSSSIEAGIVGRPNTITAFDLSNKKVIYIIMVALVAAALFATSNLRDSKTGRAFFAIRGSEVAAVSLGIDVSRYKLLAFALSGALAGIAGNLTMIGQRTASPVSFQFTVSLIYVAIAVVGGISSLSGAVAASVLFAAIYELFFQVDFLDGWFDIVTIGMLLAVLLLYPGGLGALGPAVLSIARESWARVRPTAMRAIAWLPRRSAPLPSSLDPSPPPRARSRLFPARSLSGVRKPKEAVETSGSEPRYTDWRALQLGDHALAAERSDRSPVLKAERIVVRFGGLTAVNEFSLEVREHEIVGLIGPNGAGKTTLFNAISGLNEPVSGNVHLFGEDATRRPVHVRARMGVGRTFQLIQLFPQLTVFDNLLVATHVHNDTGVVAHIALTDKATNMEQAVRNHVRQIIGLIGLEDVADRRVAGLPFGILRQVEIARALVTKAPFLMLDEPASGLDNNETEELSQLLYFIRAELGVSILLIEHDVKMVTSVSDYMYVINQGTPLAEGIPSDIQRNPEVIAAYLGEAIEEIAT